MSLSFFQIAAIVISILAFGTALWLKKWVESQPSSNERIAEVGKLIQDGANTFLAKEYKTLAVFCSIAAILILLFLPTPIWKGKVLDNIVMTLAYLIGTLFSAAAGKVGMSIATIANQKSAEAATRGIKPSFMSGYRGGAVMGMSVVGSSLLGVALVLMITDNTTALLGFSFGASSLALFAKAGGGIFTKTADISADLVGKVELGIPEDDPRNPAVIADNVGDNVGDCAGMGADLFDSNVASMAAALTMAASLDKVNGGTLNTSTVFCYAAIGLLASIIGVFTANMKEGGSPTRALNMNTYVTTAIYGILTAISTWAFGLEWPIWFASTIGLLVGVVIGIASDYFTDDSKKPVHMVAKSCETGPAFTILSGISYGLYSILPAMVGIGISALGAYKVCDYYLGDGYGMFGIAMSAVGMLSIVGMIISNDAYGPIVDNACGLVEMGGLGEKALEVTDSLDSAGNTVKAVTKGFSIGAAGLTVIALLGAFVSEVNAAAVEIGKVAEGEQFLTGFDVTNPVVFFGLLVGAAIPPVFSAMLMLGVDRNAQRMVSEIHRQFKEIIGLKEGKEGVKPEYDKCIAIATDGAIKELIPAGLLAIISTLLVGFIGGVQAVGGFITGNIVSGLIFALFMSNAGGLWDNTKKYIEAGNHGGKNSEAHKCGVIGDTVGDPFKDTAGPSINTQITVVSLIASLTSTLFLTFSLFG